MSKMPFGKRRAMFLMLLTALLSSSSIFHFGSQGYLFETTSFTFSISQVDTVRPEIHDWGIEGNASGGNRFSVWANVTDDQSGIRNVSVSIRVVQGNTSIHPLTSNSTLYVASLDPLAENHTYVLRIEAFDMANNSAVSYSRTIERYPPTTPTVDPNITMPYVVGISLLVFVVALAIALVYDKRKGPSRPFYLEDESAG